MPPGSRRRARRFALQVLYALDLNPDAQAVELEGALQEYAQVFEVELDEPTREFARLLVQNTVQHQSEVDDVIAAASRNWRLERMSRVDRNILRMSTCELRHGEGVPLKVVINEAVELAKRFGTSESPAFVNGILDRIGQSLRGE